MENDNSFGQADALPYIEDNSNLMLGIVGGVLGAVGGAIVWALVTYFTERQFVMIALLLGLAVGFGVNKLGNGKTIVYRIVGLACALLGCLAGILLTVIAFQSKLTGIGLVDLLGQLDFDSIVSLIQGSFTPIDWLFLAGAGYLGFSTAVDSGDKEATGPA